MADLNDVIKEVSEAVKAIHEGLADGKLTMIEAQKIIREGAEALLALSTALEWWLGIQDKIKKLGGK